MKSYINKLTPTKALLLVLFAITGLTSTVHAQSQEGEKKRYMIEGIATPAVFASVIANPQDRGPNAALLMKNAGCNLLDYYVGIHNFKNYVIIECSENADIAALQLTFFAAGGVTTGTMTEIITSAGLKSAGERAKKISESYKLPK